MRKRVIVFIALCWCFLFLLKNECVCANQATISVEYYSNGQVKTEQIGTDVPTRVVVKSYFETGEIKNQGLYENGRLVGDFIEYYAGGQMKVRIFFKDGQDPAHYEKYYPSGVLMEKGFYVDGAIDGALSRYYENGNLMSTMVYVNQSTDGLARTFYPDGTLREEFNYKNGYMDGRQLIYYANGELKQEAYYENNRKIGAEKIYFESGRIAERRFYKNGKLDGVVTQYYEDGTKKSEKEYELDQIHGEQKEYWRNGQLRSWVTYRYGLIIKERKFDENGKRIYEAGRFKLGPFELARSDIAGFYRMLTIFFICCSLVLIIIVIALEKKTRQLNQVTVVEPEPDSQSDSAEFNRLFPDKKEIYRRTIENVSSGIFLANKNGVIIYANYTFAQILGYIHKSGVIGLDMKKVFEPADDHHEDFWTLLQRENSVRNFKVEVQRTEEERATLLVSGSYVCDDAGNSVAIEGAVNEITAEVQLEKELEIEKKKLELILEFCEKIDTVRDFVLLTHFIIDGVCEILDVERCSLMLEEKSTHLLKICGARGLSDEIIRNQKIKLGEPIAGEVAETGHPILVTDIEKEMRFPHDKIGNYLGRSFMIVPFRLENQLSGVLCVADRRSSALHSGAFNETDFKILRIVTGRVAVAIENVTLFNELNLLTVTDPMTQMYNYRLFSDTLDQELRRQKREHRDLCLSMIDIDHFKTYNDTFGHQEGDKLLKTFGEILKSHLRETDTVCRYAGDEFCVVFPDTNLEGARLAAEKLRKMVSGYAFLRPVTLSIGIAQYRENMSKKEFIQVADKALYAAKHAGRNCVKTSFDVKEG